MLTKKNKPVITEYVVEWKDPDKPYDDFEGDFRQEQDLLIYLRTSFKKNKDITWITKTYSCDYIDHGHHLGRDYLTSTEKVLFESNKSSIQDYLITRR